jgi:hypothetical protein
MFPTTRRRRSAVFALPFLLAVRRQQHRVQDRASGRRVLDCGDRKRGTPQPAKRQNVPEFAAS